MSNLAERGLTGAPAVAGQVVRPTAIGRLSEGQTAVDFVGRRRISMWVSIVLLVLTMLSLFTRGLNLGIDFEGGVSWDVPAAAFDENDAITVLSDNGISTEGSRIQRRASESGEFIKVQVETQTDEVTEALRIEFANVAGVAHDEVNVNLVSSSWGSEITEKAVRALVIFMLVVGLFISIRFEWRMALSSIAAMIHDVIIAVGLYSMLQFIVTPATVIAFLTILGYSLYDTIVVFDRIRENETRFAAQKPPYDDVINVSVNQVVMRSLTTSFSSVVPVVSLLVVGAGILGATTLSEFALALLIGMLIGVYSSIFVASPLLAVLKHHDSNWKSRNIPRAVGEPLREMVMGGAMGSRRRRVVAAQAEDTDAPAEPAAAPVDGSTQVSAALSHPPRPRKKRRR